MPVTTTVNPELDMLRDFIKACIPFDQLAANDLEQLISSIEIRYYRQGHVFHSADSTGGLRIIRSGAVEIRTKNDRLLDRVGEGMSFNLFGLGKEQPDVRAVLIEDSLIYCLPKTIFTEVRTKYRDFDRYFHSQRSRRIRRAARHETTPSEMMSFVRDLMTKNVLTVEPSQTIQQTAELMTKHRVSSALVMSASTLKGIVTDRDIRSRAVACGIDLTNAVSSIMTADPESITSDNTVFDATLFMTQRGFHHIPVVEFGEVKGIVTSSDLMLARRDDPVYLVQHIGRQRNYQELKSIVSLMPDLMVQWGNAGIKAEQVAYIFTAVSDAVTARLIELFIDDNGVAPVPFAWLGFGSQGRTEQLLGGDQDNALLIHDDLSAQDAEWFKKLAHWVCDGLNECGYVYCPGDIMATTDKLRLTLHEWKATVDRWARVPTTDAVMRVSIFFDLRAVYGDQTLCQQLQEYMLDSVSGNKIFLAALAENVLDSQPPLGIFRNFVVEHDGEHNHELNIKKRAIIPIVDIVRIHSLANKIKAVNTVKRIQALADAKVMTINESRNLQDAFNIIMQIRLSTQVKELASGQEVNNYVNPDKLSELMRKQLKDAFSVVRDAQKGVQMRYCVNA